MMTEYEVQKLQQTMNANLNPGTMSLWKCVAGLLIVIASLAVGNWLDPIQSPSSELAQFQEYSKIAWARDED